MFVWSEEKDEIALIPKNTTLKKDKLKSIKDTFIKSCPENIWTFRQAHRHALQPKWKDKLPRFSRRETSSKFSYQTRAFQFNEAEI